MLGKIRGDRSDGKFEGRFSGRSGGRPGGPQPYGSGYKSPGPLIVLGAGMGLLAIIGYLYDSNYSNISQTSWIVYFCAAISVVFLFVGVTSMKRRK